MRVVVNNSSDRAFQATGWRSKAIPVNDKAEATLIEALKMIPLINGNSLYDLVASGSKLKKGWKLYVNGMPLPGGSSLIQNIKDSIQIHVRDRET